MIFVDSSFFIALANDRDGRHAEAKGLIEQVGGQRMATSNHVRGETWTFLRRRRGHGRAVAFLDMLQRSRTIEVVDVGPDLEARAWKWLRSHDERAYSFVDATSFALMRSLKIREALAFDGDFSAAGFIERR